MTGAPGVERTAGQTSETETCGAVSTVHVAVGDLFLRRRTHFEHFAIETQADPRERMVAVGDHLPLRDVGDGVNDGIVLIAAIGHAFELVAHLNA